MIERDFDASGRIGRFILRPQRSATWNDNLWLIAAVAGSAVPIALVLTAAGFWPVLLLCVLHLVALTAALYAVSRSLLAREVVTIGDERILIEAGHRGVERRFELGRAWARVWLQPIGRRRPASRLIVRSAGRAVELGRFLTDAEREELATDLREAVKPRALRRSSSDP